MQVERKSAGLAVAPIILTALFAAGAAWFASVAHAGDGPDFFFGRPRALITLAALCFAACLTAWRAPPVVRAVSVITIIAAGVLASWTYGAHRSTVEHRVDVVAGHVAAAVSGDPEALTAALGVTVEEWEPVLDYMRSFRDYAGATVSDITVGQGLQYIGVEPGIALTMHLSDGTTVDLRDNPALAISPRPVAEAVAPWPQGCEGTGDEALRTCARLGSQSLVGGQFYLAIDQLDWSCNHGYGTACIRIGEVYQQGFRVAENEGRAAAFFEAACEAGEGRGCWHVGDIFESAGDPETAAGHYATGCDLGYDPACRRGGR